MTITSKQKKTLGPLIIFTTSAFAYFLLLGSWSALLAVPTLAVSVGFLSVQIVEPVSAWFRRDGWK